MSQPALTHANVDDLRLAERLSNDEGRQIRRYLEQHAEPAAVRHFFAHADALRTAAQVLDKAVDGGVYLSSVADAIERGAQKKAMADELR